MVARVTLEFNDETSPGFQQLVRNLEAAEQGGDGLADSLFRDSIALQQMQKMQLMTTAAIEANTAAVRENRDSLAENANEWIALGGHVARFSAHAAEASDSFRHMVAAQRGVAKAREVYGAVALQLKAVRVGAAAATPAVAGVAATLAVAAGAALSARAAFKSTGKEIKAVSGASTEVRMMVDRVNAGLETLAELKKRTGKSAEELGIKVTSNWNRITKATNEMTDAFGSSFKNEMKSMGRAWKDMTGLTWAAEKAWGAFEGTANAATEITTGGLQLMTDYFHKADLRSQGLTESEARRREEAERMIPVQAMLHDFKMDLEKQIRWSEELREIQNLSFREEENGVRRGAATRLAAVRERVKLEERALEEIAAFEDKQGNKNSERVQRQMERVTILKRNEVLLVRAAEEEKRQAMVETAQKRQELYQHSLNVTRGHFAQEFKMRQEAAKKAQQLEKLQAQGKAGLQLQERLNLIEQIKLKLELAGGHEQQIKALEIQAAKERLDFAKKHAKDREEIVRAETEFRQEMLSIDHQHKLEHLRKENEAEKKALEDAKKMAAQKKKLAEQRQRDIEREAAKKDPITGKNEFQRRATDFSRRDIIEEIAKSRIANAGVGDIENQEKARQMARQIRAGVERQASRGQVKPSEIARAQSRLAMQNARQQLKGNDITKRQFDIIVEQGKQIEELILAQERLERKQEQYLSAQRNKHTRRRGQGP